VIPEDLRYTEAHEWVREQGDGVVRIGITDHAQSQLGDVVFVQLPDVGSAVTAGAPVGEVESTKSVSDVYAPVAGEVVEANGELSTQPEAVNADPEGSGWFAKIRVSDPGEVEQLMSKDEYDRYVAGL